MPTFDGSPRILKGALVGLNPVIPIPNVIVFQYNPETMTRKLEARATGGGEGSDRSEAFRLTGPPKETITFSAEMDAADQLERGDPLAVVAGIAPALAALELMLYPKSATIIGNAILAQAGSLEIIPPEAPMTLFVWGLRRVIPVRLTGFSITEDAFDTALNPIRAKLDLSLQVLSTADLKPAHRGYSMFVAHQIAKEILGTANLASSISTIGSGLKLF
jgi:hypothetical protein